jgi:hypothetical protein
MANLELKESHLGTGDRGQGKNDGRGQRASADGYPSNEGDDFQPLQ